MHITINQLEADPAKYVEAAREDPVYITRDGVPIAKLTGTDPDKAALVEKLFGILSPETDVDKARMERLLQ